MRGLSYLSRWYVRFGYSDGRLRQRLLFQGTHLRQGACGHGPAMVTLRVVRFLLFQFQGVARFFLAFCPSPKHFETGHGGSLHEDLFQERNSSIYALGWDMKVLVSMGMFPYLPPW